MRLKRHEISENADNQEVLGPDNCSSCGYPTALLWYSDGRFIMAVCVNCDERPATLSNHGFLSLGWARSRKCPICESLMKPVVAKYDYGKYVFECSACNHFIRAGEMLPKHSRILPKL